MSSMTGFGGGVFGGKDPAETKKNTEESNFEAWKSAEKRYENMKSKTITLTLDEFKEKSAKVLITGKFSKDLREKAPEMGLFISLFGTALLAEITFELFKEDKENGRE